jgi:hypothetical protein
MRVTLGDSYIAIYPTVLSSPWPKAKATSRLISIGSWTCPEAAAHWKSTKLWSPAGT